jgi:hypothetical protein
MRQYYASDRKKREEAKKRKKEEKRLRRLERNSAKATGDDKDVSPETAVEPDEASS